MAYKDAMTALAVLAASPGLSSAAALLLGLAVGSFLNVVIYRLPIMLERQWREECAEFAGGGESPAPGETFNLMVPRSACPGCKAPITALQNIPLLSWLLLRGRCARCGQRISVRYPLVEMLTAILTAAVVWRFGLSWPALAAVVLTWFLIALTFIDIDHQLLPDGLTLPLLWFGLLVSLSAAGRQGLGFPVDLRASVLGAVAGYASLWAVYHLFRLVFRKEGMGYGDFKLFAALGAWLGWKMLIPVILVAAVAGSVVGLVLLTVRGQSRNTPIPFGPFLASAGWLVLMWGPGIVAAYLGWFTRP